MDSLEKAVSTVTSGSDSSSGAVSALLSNDEIIDGLKEALTAGVRSAVDLLGQDGGFLNDADVKIPMPDSLNMVEKGLRTAGQDAIADEFIDTMNHAAENAVPVATDIFVDAVKAMSVEDAENILNGPDDAATQYFRKYGEAKLTDAMRPLVEAATDKVGLTAQYKALTANLGLLSGLVDTSSLDLDGYVTSKSLDGLFLKIAEEEKRIRTDPVARTTDLLQKVFGS
ncbi:MAG: DUF4197 domain-containing protein [Magnetococcales bacterium]|nr:DUF4197 domain-containing protein [Magnetococcales bacterium]